MVFFSSFSCELVKTVVGVGFSAEKGISYFGYKTRGAILDFLIEPGGGLCVWAFEEVVGGCECAEIVEELFLRDVAVAVELRVGVLIEEFFLREVALNVGKMQV
jgi:hypothetical protein